MASRRRRHGHQVPWGPDDDAWEELDDIPDDFPDEDPPGGHPRGTGGAGVREPRQPKPTLPGMAAENPEPEPDTFLDFQSDPV